MNDKIEIDLYTYGSYVDIDSLSFNIKSGKIGFVASHWCDDSNQWINTESIETARLSTKQLSDIRNAITKMIEHRSKRSKIDLDIAIKDSDRNDVGYDNCSWDFAE